MTKTPLLQHIPQVVTSFNATDVFVIRFRNFNDGWWSVWQTVIMVGDANYM